MDRLEENLLDEIELDYSRAMNRIIFDSYVEDFEAKFEIKDILQLITKQQHAKQNPEAASRPAQGLIELPHATALKEKHFEYTGEFAFEETYKEFCFSSLLIKKEAIEALQEIRVKCLELRGKEMFSFEWEKETVKRVDEFKTIQESAISQVGNQLKGSWISSMIFLIRKKFGAVGKGWFNMKETNKLTYEFGKLKRFLTVVRLNMQDSVFDLLKRSLAAFHKFFEERVPRAVTVLSEKEVENEYAPEQLKLPILSVDFIQVAGKEDFNFLFKPEKIKNDLLALFEKAVEELKTIPDLEPKILEGLNKAKKTETYILTPVLPKAEPETPDPRAVPRRYPDENKWVWDLRAQLKGVLEFAVSPLSEYKRTFDKYKNILSIRPGKFVREIEEGENQGNLEFIRSQILKWQREELRLRDQIPEEVQVGAFMVNCKEVLRILLGKYQEINKKLIEMMAKKLKENGAKILRRMRDIEKRLYLPPQDIESLSDLKDFVDQELPQSLNEIKKQTQVCVQIYEMLEGQSYKLSKPDLDRRWVLLGGPKKIQDLVGNQILFLCYSIK